MHCLYTIPVWSGTAGGLKKTERIIQEYLSIVDVANSFSSLFDVNIFLFPVLPTPSCFFYLHPKVLSSNLLS